MQVGTGLAHTCLQSENCSSCSLISHITNTVLVTLSLLSSLFCCCSLLAFRTNLYGIGLMQVYNNNSLKQLLVNTTSKSIIVIEDIDCSLDLAGQRKAGKENKFHNKDEPTTESTSSVTLSGLLNFTDGLWSCCGDERIIIFTTNHVEKLDAALLRPGRMDMHIHMSYCSFETFKALAKNYLSLEDHPLYDDVKSLLEGGKLITPAQVTEHLFGNRDDPTAAINVLIEWLQKPEEQKPEETTKTDSKETSEEEVKADVKENGATENGSAESADLRQKVDILEGKVQSLEKNFHQKTPKEDIMSNGEVLHVENGDLHVESDDGDER